MFTSTKPILSTLVAITLTIVTCVTMTGCNESIVYKRSIGDLNQKAQTLLQQGDTAGAVARLESALDLDPEEPSTLFNLAVAYRANGDLNKSIQAFKTLLEQGGGDKGKLLKSLGVVYEEIGDTLMTKSSEAGEENDAATEKTLKKDALDAYELATQHYEEALKHIQDKAPLEKHVAMLADVVKKLEEDKPE
ncbi:MAG: tetratricopeptide repeat protein [Vampirovibrio sp.]|nr:tetratricopeptide repeat protein [Vampirovibrio sp.]